MRQIIIREFAVPPLPEKVTTYSSEGMAFRALNPGSWMDTEEKATFHEFATDAEGQYAIIEMEDGEVRIIDAMAIRFTSVDYGETCRVTFYEQAVLWIRNNI